jgi:hypothetical protein
MTLTGQTAKSSSHIRQQQHITNSSILRLEEGGRHASSFFPPHDEVIQNTMKALAM